MLSLPDVIWEFYLKKKKSFQESEIFIVTFLYFSPDTYDSCDLGKDDDTSQKYICMPCAMWNSINPFQPDTCYIWPSLAED